MNTKITVLAGAAALATAAVGLALDAPASAHAPMHTLTIRTHQIADKIVGHADIAADKDLQNGAVTGYDVTSCQVNVVTHIAHCDVAVARSNGMLYARAHVNVDTGQGGGAITGGTRHFAGATGTITVASPQVTFHWTN